MVTPGFGPTGCNRSLEQRARPWTGGRPHGVQARCVHQGEVDSAKASRRLVSEDMGENWPCADAQHAH